MKRFYAILVLIVLSINVGCWQPKQSPASSNLDGPQPPTSGDVADPPASPENDSSETNTIAYGTKFPKVLAVEAAAIGQNNWRFDVTLSSTYDSPQRYADAWRVLDEHEQQLGIRVLGHDHANQQPFTRSATIHIPDGLKQVFVEGRDQTYGWSGQRFVFEMPPLEAAVP